MKTVSKNSDRNDFSCAVMSGKKNGIVFSAEKNNALSESPNDFLSQTNDRDFALCFSLSPPEIKTIENPSRERFFFLLLSLMSLVFFFFAGIPGLDHANKSSARRRKKDDRSRRKKCMRSENARKKALNLKKEKKLFVGGETARDARQC